MHGANLGETCVQRTNKRILTEIQIGRLTDKNRQIYVQTHRLIDRLTDRQTDRQTDTNRQIEKQTATDKWTDRLTDI